MKEIALRLRRRMHKLGFSQGELSKVCSLISADLYAEADQPTLRRDRIAKILMNLQPRPGSSVATAISDSELLVLAHALQCSVEWLSGRGLEEDPIVWNVLSQPERGAHLLQLLNEYEDQAGEINVWSEYPLCSLTTEKFMVAFHYAHFGDMDTAGVTNGKRELVDFFNKTGRTRRGRILRHGRPFRFTGLIYDSELQRVAAGEGPYRSISKPARRATLEHMIRVLGEPALKMSLLIVNEEEVRRVKLAWRDYETVGVMGESFSLWNYHSGVIGWSENPRCVRHHCELINEMKMNLRCRNAEETIQYLKDLRSLL